MTDLTDDRGIQGHRPGLDLPTQAFIDGAFRPRLGQDLRQREPGHRRGALRDRGLRRRRRGFRRREGARGLRGRPLVAAASLRTQAVLIRLAKLMKRNARELAVMESLDSGKTDLRLRNRRHARDDHCLIWHAEADRQDLRPGLARLRRPYRDDRARTGGRRRAGPAVELPAPDAGLEDRPGAGGGLLGDREAGRGDLADRAARRGTGDGGGRAARVLQRACRARGRRWANRSGGTWMSTWSPSPARPRPGGGSCATRRSRTSRRSRWRWAARTPPSCSTTPRTSIGWRPMWSTAPSGTWARTARPPRG
jgi:hypothetical protein